MHIYTSIARVMEMTIVSYTDIPCIMTMSMFLRAPEILAHYNMPFYIVIKSQAMVYARLSTRYDLILMCSILVLQSTLIMKVVGSLKYIRCLSHTRSNCRYPIRVLDHMMFF